MQFQILNIVFLFILRGICEHESRDSYDIDKTSHRPIGLDMFLI